MYSLYIQSFAELYYAFSVLIMYTSFSAMKIDSTPHISYALDWP